MYQNGEYVVYGGHGVCCVIGVEKLFMNGAYVDYLVLESRDQKGSMFHIPMNNTAGMAKIQPVLDREEMETLLDSPQIREDGWIDKENVRKQYYRQLTGENDRTARLRMICTLYAHRAALRAAGKKFHQCDDNFLRDAERMMVSEISMSLQLTAEQARDYLRKKLGA